MKTPRTLVILLAGGQGKRLGPLTQNRAKPVLPFLGLYRLIDFPLSNCVHSGLHDVWVVEQFQAHSINEHLQNGRPWDLDKTYGGLQILPPIQGDPESGWHEGNADALWRNRRQIRAFDPDLVLVLSADAIYKFDYRDAIASHMERGAQATLVTTHLPSEQATRFGNVQSDDNGRVTRFAYKPDTALASNQAGQSEVTCEVFVYNAKVLLETLDELAKRTGKPTEEAALSDFGHELLPDMVRRGQIFTLPMGGYWRDVGTIESYFEAHQEFLADEPPFRLDARDWPILNRNAPRLPARFGAAGKARNSFVCPGCEVDGEVENSVLGPGVIIERGARVENAILLSGARVAAGVVVSRAIVEMGGHVRQDVRGGDGIEVVS